MADKASHSTSERSSPGGKLGVKVSFYSYLKELTGCAETSETIDQGATLAELQERLVAKFPKLAGMRKSILVAVGVDYQPATYVLQPDDEVAFFPPVQGG